LDTDSDVILGYRFSVINSSGKTLATQDIYRSSQAAVLSTFCYQLQQQYSKIDVMKIYKDTDKRVEALTDPTIRTSTIATDADLVADGISTSTFPSEPEEMQTWSQTITDELFIDKFYQAFFVWQYIRKADNRKADNIWLIEPIYGVTLGGLQFALTENEILLYAYDLYANGKILANGYTAGCYASCSGKHYDWISYRIQCPLASWFYEDDVGVKKGWWKAGSALSSRANLDTLIQGGYGVWLIWGESDVTYTVTFQATPSDCGSLSTTSVSVPAGSTIRFSGTKASFKMPMARRLLPLLPHRQLLPRM
jgi:hypothetical protein